MKARVLIVDDSATVRADMRGVLSAAGFGTTLCESLGAARKALSEGEFDLLILDMVLPDGEGVELLEELRRVPRTSHLPVLMLSTEAAVVQRLKGLSHGANDYVGKPYDPAYVVRRAHELTQVPEQDGTPRLVSAGRRRRVMVVDGRIDFRHRASDALRKDGHDVIIAESGEDAMRLLEAQPVDCILLDLEMPGLDGPEWVRAVRTLPATAQVAVVGLTAGFDAKLISEALAVKVDAFCSKTEDIEVLRAQVRTELRRRAESEQQAPPPMPRNPSGSFPALPRTSSGSHHPAIQAPAPHAAPAAVPAAAPAPSAGALPGALFEALVARCGLSPVIAASTMTRACRKAGVDPQLLTATSLARALPTIRDMLHIFLDAQEAERRIQAIQALTKGDAGAQARSR
ncbi:response regulator receiver domain-containing protein [Archangium gephyra]|uniref:Phosphate regulon transcriptional regulatory protein PhoB n=1 Tax=Archangium gephyra TaxID=48 RepID=A0AAC8QDY6_9BACT|nr:response regulator [Archangium gephyra]AKJ05977.1 Phosphate regulon transcriptional regulatory protein PhoB [Archangium gephyra]REG27268.1 response regulator receiver domain-containing protein [Archangium gephyra]